jgi:hypothetical protein
MVDIRSIADYSHPSRHEQGTKQEATSHSTAGRFRRTNAHDATTAATHWQHSAAMAVVTPPGAGPKACWRLCASSSTTLQAHMLHRRRQSSGVTTSTSSSSQPSTQCPVEGGRQTTPVGHQRRLRHTRAHRWLHARRHHVYQWQVSLQWICGLNLSVAARVRAVASPSSAVGRGVATSTGTSVWQTPPL